MGSAMSPMPGTARHSRPSSGPGNPWHVLAAMMVGFFMIMLDSTIVAVANPTIMANLHVGYATVVWVTSSYLLGYAVVLLVAGWLGDRFGPKNIYVTGLAVFTVASVWCGLSGTAAALIVFRVVQGVGAGLLSPQTLAVITRIFPGHRRGAAMSVWGATAGVASLFGPLVGGALVGKLGWQWIFLVNVPVGILALALAVWLFPVLPVHVERVDMIGVGLSGLGVFLIVFGLQEGQSARWEPWIWAVLVAGVGFLSAFVHWQSINNGVPLVPLSIFADRYFSLCSVGVATIAFVTTAMMLPLMFYAQAACGLSPTRSALLIAPLAITSGVLAPFVGTIVDRAHPVPVLGFGFSVLAISLTWLSIEMASSTPIWQLVLPLSAMGVGTAFIWSPLAATATRNLPPSLAGAGSGIYNVTRQLGAVLGSAAMAAFMTSRVGAEMPPMSNDGHAAGEGGSAVQLPEFLREPFAAAMSESMLLPAFIALFGIIAALLLAGIASSLISFRIWSKGGEPAGRVPVGRRGLDKPSQVVHEQEPDVRPVVARARRKSTASAPVRRRELVEPSRSWLSGFVPRSESIGSARKAPNGVGLGDEECVGSDADAPYRLDPADPFPFGRPPSGRRDD